MTASHALSQLSYSPFRIYESNTPLDAKCNTSKAGFAESTSILTV